MFTVQDCQYYQQHYLWKPPCSNNVNAFPGPGPSTFRLLDLKTGQLDGVQGPFQWLPPHMESSFPPAVPHFKESQCNLAHGHGVKATLEKTSASAQKNFLILDQSGDQIRLLSSSFHSPCQHQVITPRTPVGFCNFSGEKLEAGQSLPVKPSQNIEYCIKSEGGDMHEDTEEINALLYSDSFGEDDDDADGEDDELTSTGHSPFAIIRGNEVHEKAWELTEEVVSTDCSSKRHKLLDGGYRKSSLVDTADSLKLARFCNYDNDVESSCARGRDLDKDMDSNLGTRQKQAKIHETLKIVGSIVPGMKSKDPVLIIDEAISYLKSLKEKAKALGVSCTEVQYPLAP